MLSSLAPARRRFFLTCGALAFAVLVSVVVVAVVRQPQAVNTVSQDAQPPVLLVPGYGGSKGSLDVLARALRAAGRTAEVVTLGGDNTGDLNIQADHLGSAVRAELRHTGARSVDLVGYSAGGVVVRLWIAQPHGASSVRRVVTLGSPHHGTELAGLASDIAPQACPVACRQLASDSAVILSLNAGDETPAGPLWVSIWSQNDTTVVPPDSASLNGATDISVQSVCPQDRVSHGGLPSDATVIAMTLFELRRSPPSAPGVSICR
jgi:triacylglycerol lipase